MRPIRFVRELGKRFLDDNVMNASAAMAYYSVVALFPMLVFIIAIGMLILPGSTIQDGAQTAAAALPAAVRSPFVSRVQSLVQQSHGTFAFFGALLALWGARGGLTSLMQALNGMFHAQETRSWVRRQLVAILLALAVAVLVVLSLALLVAGPVAGGWVSEHLGISHAFDVVWTVVTWVVAGVIVLLVWAMLYKFLPNTDLPFRLFTPGAIVGVVLWLAASFGFGVYLGHFHRYETTYGTLGGAIIFLTWLWLTNMALLVGAEINDVRAHRKLGAHAAELEHNQADSRPDRTPAPDARGPRPEVHGPLPAGST